MFERLQSKWKVNGTQLFLILCVFAIGGSATGWLGKIIMNWLSIERGWLWTLVYIILVTLIWPLSVILVSIPFGQFRFFTNYLKRMGTRMKILKPSPAQPHIANPTTPASRAQAADTIRIAIFASGTGTNAKKIIEYFGVDKKVTVRSAPRAVVSVVVCNKPQAGVLNLAHDAGVPVIIIEKERFFRGDAYITELEKFGINFIVLAGFLWKIPQPLINAYRNRIVNIHPALLPNYGGKGMYGLKVHEAVIAANEAESGITIHYVDEHYDNGDIIFQARVEVSKHDTPETLADKIHRLEHEHYPRIIEELIYQPKGS